MNKTKVNNYLPKAAEAITVCGIADGNGKIIKTYRSCISSFGAAIVTGSFKAATAFFSVDATEKSNQKQDEKVMRSKLIIALNYIVNRNIKTADEICKEIIIKDDKTTAALCEEYINASIALKLAMNLFEQKQA